MNLLLLCIVLGCIHALPVRLPPRTEAPSPHRPRRPLYGSGAPPHTAHSGLLPVTQGSAPYAQVLNISMETEHYFFTGASFGNVSAQTFLLSGGDWYQGLPYPFFVWSFDASSGAPLAPTYAYPTVPGSLWPTRGLLPTALFSGMSFQTEAAVFGGFDAGSESPLWIETVPGVSGNWWETAAPMQSSLNGSIVAYALTSLANYDPLAAKHAEVVVVDTSAFPARVLLRDVLANGTGMESLLLSDDGSTLVMISAWDPKGSINSSLVRVYNVVEGVVSSEITTGWVDAACMSGDGKALVLTTCDSENAIEVYTVDVGAGLVTLVSNSSYPQGLPPSSTFTYADTCKVTAGGGLFVVFPLWWGGSINQTAVAYWKTLPTAPTWEPYLPPTTLWLSNPISPQLQESVICSLRHTPNSLHHPSFTPTHKPQNTFSRKNYSSIIASATLGSFFVYTSWGGKALSPSTDPTPPTIHIFSEAQPSAPILEISTPGTEDASNSGSIQSFDLCTNGTQQLLILAEGIGNHANIGSDGGLAYLFAVDVSSYTL